MSENDQVCTNCGKLLSEHYHESSGIYCYHNTTGDTFTTDPICPFAIASVSLSKQEHGKVITTMTLHWRNGVDNEDEMRGIATEAALKEKPGFSIDGILVKILDAENLHMS